jgi:hypothetical protein
MKIFLILGAFVILMVLAAGAAWAVWASLGDTEISAGGWLALVLGAVLTIALGVGLMFLVFYSSRRGYDDAAQWPPEE